MSQTHVAHLNFTCLLLAPLAVLMHLAGPLVTSGQYPETRANAVAEVSDRPDLDALFKIKQQGLQHSKVMEIESYLTDVYGPRLTGSPNFKLAADYVQQQLKEYGLTNVHVEKYRFGRGWANDRFYAHAVSPQPYPLLGFVKAWTPGTNGWVTGDAVDVSSIQSEADFVKYAGKLKGKFVLTTPIYEAKPSFEPSASRLSDADLAQMTKQQDPTWRGPSVPRPLDAKLPEKKIRFFRDEGVLAMLEAAANFPPLLGIQQRWLPQGDYGTFIVAGGGSPKPNDPVVPTMVVLAAEHYNRIMRTLAKNISVTLEMNIQNKFFDNDLDAFNVIGEIPGTDKSDELIMLGAHLDSWHGGTGATDNASGATTMMEAVRILKAARLKVRRTVRIGLWSGEEQGQQGSRAYVREHFYDRATGTKKPEHSKLSVYFNSDAGAGAIRGVALQEIEAVAPIFAAWMEPLRNMDMTALPIRHTLSTDVVQFDLAGLPAFQFVQDPLDYSTRAHHTNMDTYERVPPFDLMGNAVKVAFFVYQAANRDQLLPRKPMPALDSATSFSRPAVGLFNFRGWTDELTHFSSCIGWFAGGFIGGAQQRLRFVPHPWPEAPAEQR